MSRFASPGNYPKSLNGSPRYLGVIDATTSAKTNASASVPFTIPYGATLKFQALVSAHVAPGGGTMTISGVDTVDPTITTSNAVLYDLNAVDYFTLRPDQNKVQAILPTGTGNVRFWVME
jgi:hypothetical protein